MDPNCMGRLSHAAVREVLPEELLGRQPVDLDLREIAAHAAGKTILITGAGGSIGSELCRQLAPLQPGKLLLLDQDENNLYLIDRELARDHSAVPREAVIADIRDRKRLADLFDAYRPAIVFHAAAHKHVPMMENNPTEAIKNNIFGTMAVAECADRYRAERFVFISTDKSVRPACIMGATKRIAEMRLQAMNPSGTTRFTIVRFGNVIGSRGSVLPLFQEQLLKGGPLTVTHPGMARYFMTIREAAQLVLRAGAVAQGGELFILDMGEPVKITDLAERLIRLSGLRPGLDIDIIYTGVRPGEKIVEEVFTAEEARSAKKHDRFLVCDPPACLYEERLRIAMRKLEAIMTSENSLTAADKIKAALRECIPDCQL